MITETKATPRMNLKAMIPDGGLTGAISVAGCGPSLPFLPPNFDGDELLKSRSLDLVSSPAFELPSTVTSLACKHTQLLRHLKHLNVVHCKISVTKD